MEYYSAIKRDGFEAVLMMWMNIEPIIQSEVSQKEKDKYRILRHTKKKERKKKRKITEWERLEISSRKLKIPREHFMQRWVQ